MELMGMHDGADGKDSKQFHPYGKVDFKGSHLTLGQILYWWPCDLPLKQVSHETTVSEHTIVDWNHFIREVYVVHFLNNPIMIGGPGSFKTVIIISSIYKFILM